MASLNIVAFARKRSNGAKEVSFRSRERRVEPAGEWLESNLPSLPLVPTYLPSWSTDQAQPSLEERWQKIVELRSLQSGCRCMTCWSRAMSISSLASPKPVVEPGVLPGIELIDHASETLSLRGRRLPRA